MRMIEAFTGRIPIFGVCLGHQSLVEVFGGKVVRAQRLMHGKVSPVVHDGKGLFAGLPQDFESGIFRLAQQFPGVQLIPCWIDNVQRVMPKGEVGPVPILCTVTFGAPCNLVPDEPKADFLKRAREAVVALKPGGGA